MKYLAALGVAALLAATAADAQPFPSQNLKTNQVSCGTSATLVAPMRYRNGITIKVPSGGATVFIGAAGVTTSTGFSIDASAAMTLQPYSGPVYCVVATGTQTVSYAETF